MENTLWRHRNAVPQAHLRDELNEPEGGVVAHDLDYPHDLVQGQLGVGEYRAGQRAEPASAFAASVPLGSVRGLPVEPGRGSSAIRAKGRVAPLVQKALDSPGTVLLKAFPRLSRVP
ncbi:MAG: hypothetical protein IJ125_08315 [Atopobiaceae bacterium]|nr:hypothetical protein [Atopobiaceae bacterium]